ncbi:transposase [Rhizobium leguminosarum]|uniref:transposase n=1 Tax=Rhizobium leguminosarum TaxID=384 RepID=UPI00103FAC3E|nr:transposase [Rhizobium leguminosarum]TBZ35879.1 hypothetical protein E0H44_30365 [Rhizobium leguminosarum bv. viciae]TBZ73293.1 hypothetical protein E0H61_28430 [Rhizobium leguminosarum bv. viciae]TBZ80476.1 hypothetical protein E0H53_30340 [Rhizobium leguminosarum bv. viciae]TBZ94132.1 hypothetical protein E0H56_14475 [Rhizobium leguminosarum bv. viciae]
MPIRPARTQNEHWRTYHASQRRRWSREDKERLVASCFEPDAVISEVASAAGIDVRKPRPDRRPAGSVEI